MAKTPSIDQELIRQLAMLLKETDLSEIEVEQDDLRIRIASGRGRSVEYVTAGHSAPAAAAPTVEAPAAETTNDADILKSPMVGTSYFAPAPGAAPYVQIGDKVKAGQTVMIVEAMKTMNQIAAHKAGTIKALLVEDSQPVEYGEPLMVIG
jgi:acetyl-CoA carboxylase biotin carboxyl carrier protein